MQVCPSYFALLLSLSTLVATSALADDPTAATSPAAGMPSTSSAPPDQPSDTAGSVPAPEVKIIDVKEGTGDEAAPHKAAIVQYTGWIFDPSAPDRHGKKFDSTLDRPGHVPFGFVVGAGRVIKGLDQGIVGMKPGGKRTLVVPPELGYGVRGAGTQIPPGATLIFDIELLAVRG